jgi:hypothetical protein
MMLVAAGAVAQDPDPRYTPAIKVHPPVVEIGDVAHIEVWAGFDSDRDWAISFVTNDLLMSDGSEGVTSFGRGALRSVGCDDPIITERGVEGLCAFQYNSETSVLADPSDPILYFTADFRPTEGMDRRIELSTRTSEYKCYVDMCCLTAESRVDELAEGSASIRIVACRADFNEDGALDIFDFLAFMNAFDAGEELADFDFDGELTVFDFLEFQNRFDLGC